MSKSQTRRARLDPKDIARDLLAATGEISSGDLARASGLTRQATYLHLQELVRRGEVSQTGAKRGTRYRRLAALVREYPIADVRDREDEVWREVKEEVGFALTGDAAAVAAYAATEMLNNAADHSNGTLVRVTIWTSEGRFAVEIVDDGVGVFGRVRQSFALPDEFSAVVELTKGKRTTMPERHSGQGIFFTSKAVDIFVLASGALRWRVDNDEGDQAVGDIPPMKGTRVFFEIHPAHVRPLGEIFDTYSVERDGEFPFNRSHLRLELAVHDDTFFSRSEAKRLAQGLEAFEVVELDFEGVRDVGQGFVDELFRVWARDHPETRLIPVNAGPGVRAMIERGLS